MNKSVFNIPLAVFALMAAQPALAHGDEESPQHQAAAAHHHEEGEAHDNAMTDAEAWQTLQSSFEQAQVLYDQANLEGFHEITDSMMTAVKTLEMKYPDDARLAPALKQLQKVVEDLHVKADGGDTAGTASALKKLKGGLLLVEANLPEDIRDGDENSANGAEHDHGDENGHENHTH